MQSGRDVQAGKPKLDQGVYLYSKLLSLWKLQDLCYSTCLHGHCAFIPGKHTCFHHSSAHDHRRERFYTEMQRVILREFFRLKFSDPCTGYHQFAHVFGVLLASGFYIYMYDQMQCFSSNSLQTIGKAEVRASWEVCMHVH
ncbi:hypothetical protein NC652_009978 [Populus alba x Populus x berolinensis]|nr:hypothetical protein NC652_009978 [Populus alba x Populus x berolinensis]